MDFSLISFYIKNASIIEIIGEKSKDILSSNRFKNCFKGLFI